MNCTCQETGRFVEFFSPNLPYMYFIPFILRSCLWLICNLKFEKPKYLYGAPSGIPLPLLKCHMRCKYPVKRCWDQISLEEGVKQSDLSAPFQADTSTHKSAGRGGVGD